MEQNSTLDRESFIVKHIIIQPLSLGGPDILQNMIVVCPNHHKLFDNGAITINLEEKKIVHVSQDNEINKMTLIVKHNIDEKYINYHNLHIFKCKNK